MNPIQIPEFRTNRRAGGRLQRSATAGHFVRAGNCGKIWAGNFAADFIAISAEKQAGAFTSIRFLANRTIIGHTQISGGML